MRCLREFEINGDIEDVMEVTRLFGEIRIGSDVYNDLSGEHATFIIKRFKNYYKDSSGESPLYFLIPSKPIHRVWPDDSRKYDDIQLGSIIGLNGPGVSAYGIAFHLRGGRSLYICTSPICSSVNGIGNLGI